MEHKELITLLCNLLYNISQHSPNAPHELVHLHLPTMRSINPMRLLQIFTSRHHSKAFWRMMYTQYIISGFISVKYIQMNGGSITKSNLTCYTHERRKKTLICKSGQDPAHIKPATVLCIILKCYQKALTLHWG